MSRFLQKALEKLPKLNQEQIRDLLMDSVRENEILEMVLSSMNSGILVSDQKHRLLFHNKSLERLLPLHPESSDQPVYRQIRDQEIGAFLEKVLEGNETVHNREFYFGKGYTRVLSLSVLPLVRQGRIRGNLLILEDVTERKNREARFRRAENLASLTTLAAGVAHEIKNPLGSLGIHIQLIQKILARQKQEPCGEPVALKALDKHLNVVNEEVDRLNGIVVDFLFAVRPMDIHLIPGSLVNVVRETLDFLVYELEESGIQIHWDLEKDLHEILLDERFVKQAVLNIVKNAIHAMESGGTLTIHLRENASEQSLVFQDTGPGIPDETLEKIFEPYFTTKDHGSGLGLTLVYKIMKEHGGDIQVHSQLGQGTAFSLIFPLPQGQQALLSYGGNNEADHTDR